MKLSSPGCNGLGLLLFVLSCGQVQTCYAAEEKPDSYTAEFTDEKPDLVATGRNPYFVLEAGFQAVLANEDEVLTITVLNETRQIDGVQTRVVEEREGEAGELTEVSRNFYAISQRTNSVYYFGEEVDIYKDGKVVKHEGAWLAGEKGARFGLFMPGLPLLGAKYYQEVAPGQALDRAEIVSLDASQSTPLGAFRPCLKIHESSPLEPGHGEDKHYARGVGLIQDESLVLTDVRQDGKPVDVSTLVMR